MPHSKPSYAEIYAWNEPILSSVAIAWGIFVSSYYGWSVPAVVLGIVVTGFGFALMFVQSSTIRTFIDFTAPTFTATRSPKFLVPFVLKIWPMSIIIRTVCHFFFTWWWAVLGISIATAIGDIADVRFVLYMGLASLHADRLTRIIQWMRR